MSLRPVLSKFTSALLAAMTAGALSASVAAAAIVTIDEAAMDAIFSQSAFGSTPIDIRVTELTQIVDPDLTKVTTKRESHELLYDMAATDGSINIFFIEELSYCGHYSTRIVGCGAISKPGVIVETGFASGFYGTELLAHEMSHNLGLTAHEPGLLSTALDGDTTLTTAQTATLLASSLVQSDPLGLFVTINPIQILAQAPSLSMSTSALTPVPLPAGGWLLLAGLGSLAAARRGRKAI